MMNIGEFQSIIQQWIQWVGEENGFILSDGEPLSPCEIRIAENVGVHDPGRVRVQVVPVIDIPIHLTSQVPRGAWATVPENPPGMCFGYGIRLSQDGHFNRRSLLAHELTHTRQMEDLGFQVFTETYFQEILVYGYGRGPLEVEAFNNMARFS